MTRYNPPPNPLAGRVPAGNRTLRARQHHDHRVAAANPAGHADRPHANPDEPTHASHANHADRETTPHPDPRSQRPNMTRLVVDRTTAHQILDQRITTWPVLTNTQPAGLVDVHRTGERKRACQIQVLATEHTTLDDALAQLAAPGTGNRDDLILRLLQVHDRAIRRLTPDDQAALTTRQLNTAWDRHATRLCWNTRFVIHTPTTARYLAATGKATSEPLVNPDGTRRHIPSGDDQARGYTTDPAHALPDEPEAVNDLYLELFTSRAQLKHAASLHERLGRAVEIITTAATDADTRDLHVIRQRIERIKQRRAA